MARTKKLAGSTGVLVRMPGELARVLEEWAKAETPLPGEPGLSRNDLIVRLLREAARAGVPVLIDTQRLESLSPEVKRYLGL